MHHGQRGESACGVRGEHERQRRRAGAHERASQCARVSSGAAPAWSDARQAWPAHAAPYHRIPPRGWPCKCSRVAGATPRKRKARVGPGERPQRERTGARLGRQLVAREREVRRGAPAAAELARSRAYGPPQFRPRLAGGPAAGLAARAPPHSRARAAARARFFFPRGAAERRRRGLRRAAAAAAAAHAPALHVEGGSFCRSLSSLMMRLDAMAAWARSGRCVARAACGAEPLRKHRARARGARRAIPGGATRIRSAPG